KPRITVLVCMIIAAAASHLIPHPPNMASIAAVALFGGAYLSDKRLAFLVPLAALFLSDLVLGLYGHMEIVYGSFTLVVCLGLLLCASRRSLSHTQPESISDECNAADRFVPAFSD